MEFVKYQEAVESAAESGNLEMVQNILNLAEEKKIELDYRSFIKPAIFGGNLEMAKLIWNYVELKIIGLEYHYFMGKIFEYAVDAVDAGHLEIVEWISNLMAKEGFPPNYQNNGRHPRISLNS